MERLIWHTFPLNQTDALSSTPMLVSVQQCRGNKWLFLIVTGRDFDSQGLYHKIIENTRTVEPTLSWTENLITTIKESASLNSIDAISCGLVLIKDEGRRLLLSGEGRLPLFLQRMGKTYELPLPEQGLKGDLTPEDILLLGPKTFTLLDLTPLVTNSELKSSSKGFVAVSGVAFGFMKPGKVALPKINLGENLKQFKQFWHDKYAATLQTAIPPERQLFLNRKRRYALGLSVIFLFLLGMSLGFGAQKRQEAERRQAEQQLVENVTYRLSQAEALQGLNPLRAKSLLEEARQIMNTYKQSHVPEINLEELQQKVDGAYEQVARQYTVRNPEIFYDLALLKDGFTPTKIAFTDPELSLLDESHQALSLLNIQTKAGTMIAGADKLPLNAQMGTIEDWIFIYSGNNLQILDKQKKTQVNSFTLSQIKVNQLAGYGSNAYIMDIGANQVWRLRGTASGLAKPEAYFDAVQDLRNAVGMAFDGSLWILYSDGGIEKYTSGIKDAYYPSIGLDLPLDHPVGIYTDDTAKSLYIWDKKNKRVVVVSKTGEYLAQYAGDILGQAVEVAVSEPLRKIFVVAGSKIYGVDIK